jgi:predicted RNA methylase
LNPREIIRAYQAGTLELDEAELDAALGLGPQRWNASPELSAQLSEDNPGESIVNVATPYPVCRGLFEALALTDRDVVVDLGCGEGRVLLYGALATAARFVGIEIVASRVLATRQAAARLGVDIDLVHGNVLDHDFAHGTVFYMFRPFSVETEQAVIAALSRQAVRRSIRVAAHRMLPSSFDADVFARVSGGALCIYQSRLY